MEVALRQVVVAGAELDVAVVGPFLDGENDAGILGRLLHHLEVAAGLGQLRTPVERRQGDAVGIAGVGQQLPGARDVASALPRHIGGVGDHEVAIVADPAVLAAIGDAHDGVAVDRVGEGLAHALVEKRRTRVLGQLNDEAVAALGGLDVVGRVGGELSGCPGVDIEHRIELARAQAVQGRLLLAFAIVDLDAVKQRQSRAPVAVEPFHDHRAVGVGGDDPEGPAADAVHADDLEVGGRHDDAVVLGEDVGKFGVATLERKPGNVLRNRLDLDDLAGERRIQPVIGEGGCDVVGRHLAAVVEQHTLAERHVPHVQLVVRRLDPAGDFELPTQLVVDPGEAVPLQARIGIDDEIGMPGVRGIGRAPVGGKLCVGQRASLLRRSILRRRRPEQGGIEGRKEGRPGKAGLHECAAI